MLGAIVVLDQVLSNLDGSAGESGGTAMKVDRVGDIASRIRLIVADMEVAGGAQGLDQRHSKARVSVPQDADIPFPLFAAEGRREGVDGQQGRRLADDAWL